jgi:hypothetical protein
MEVFPASWDAFQMLQRLVFRGPMRDCNREVAAELIAAGFAVVEGDRLLPTRRGIEAERRALRVPAPPKAA